MRILEKLLWISGCLMLSIFLGHLTLAEYKRASSVAAFKAQNLINTDSISTASTGQSPEFAAGDNSDNAPSLDAASTDPDQSLWSAGRIASYAASLTEDSSDILGLFSIPRLGLEVPVYESASELHMDRGVARIDGTGEPGQAGNMGIAGHRDGYFRVLKDIRFGDNLIFTSAEGSQTYVVQQLMVVDPSAVGVLDPTSESAITLITCYPFYFVGHAPERFVVRAVLQES
jgi:sortase A